MSIGPAIHLWVVYNTASPHAKKLNEEEIIHTIRPSIEKHPDRTDY